MRIGHIDVSLCRIAAYPRDRASQALFPEIPPMRLRHRPVPLAAALLLALSLPPLAFAHDAQNQQIKNLAAGTDPTDAVNLHQLEQASVQLNAGVQKKFEAAQDLADAGDAATLAASKTYTDTTATQTLASAKAYTDARFAAWTDSFTQYRQQVDTRFAQTDRRIDQVGAMGSAMTHMAVNAANGDSAKGRLALGVGAQGGQGAVSVGYGKRIGDRGSFSFGASFASGESSVGGGFGFDL